MTLLSGQIAVATAGTAENGPASPRGGIVVIKALNANTGLVLVGDDGSGDVAAANGFELDAGESVELDLGSMGNLGLEDLWFDVTVNGEGVCFIFKG